MAVRTPSGLLIADEPSVKQDRRGGRRVGSGRPVGSTKGRKGHKRIVVEDEDIRRKQGFGWIRSEKFEPREDPNPDLPIVMGEQFAVYGVGSSYWLAHHETGEAFAVCCPPLSGTNKNRLHTVLLGLVNLIQKNRWRKSYTNWLTPDRMQAIKAVYEELGIIFLHDFEE